MSAAKRILGLMSVAVLGMVTAACGGDEGSGGGAGSPASTSEAASDTGKLNATEKEFAIALDPSTASSGQVDFEITNEGPSLHEFVVFQTDLAPDALPVKGRRRGRRGQGGHAYR